MHFNQNVDISVYDSNGSSNWLYKHLEYINEGNVYVKDASFSIRFFMWTGLPATITSSKSSVWEVQVTRGHYQNILKDLPMKIKINRALNIIPAGTKLWLMRVNVEYVEGVTPWWQYWVGFEDWINNVTVRGEKTILGTTKLY